mmetsp:Transcript_49583/g.94747  ORF Transcript_49583/g.94747 Transcript_49583/m.94747 type:complete len:227 (-) Transcript_49583:173-853(-)
MGLRLYFGLTNFACSDACSTALLVANHMRWVCITSSGESTTTREPELEVLLLNRLSSGAYTWLRAKGLKISNTSRVELRSGARTDSASCPPECTRGVKPLECCKLMKSKVVLAPTSSSNPSTGAMLVRITASCASMRAPCLLSRITPELPTTAHVLNLHRVSSMGSTCKSSLLKARWDVASDSIRMASSFLVDKDTPCTASSVSSSSTCGTLRSHGLQGTFCMRYM